MEKEILEYQKKLKEKEENEMAYMHAQSVLADAGLNFVETLTMELDIFDEEDNYNIYIQDEKIMLEVFYSQVTDEEITDAMLAQGFHLSQRDLSISNQGSKVTFTFMIQRLPVEYDFICGCGGWNE